MSEAHERDVLILGGGASGALLAIQMLYASDSATRVTLVERSSGLGKGFAYGAAHPIDLLNVRASNMSAYPDDGDHFLAWLDRNGVGEEKPSGNAFHFVSRLTFGNYLESQLLDLAALPSNRGRFTRVDGEAVAISRTPEGIIVTLNNFRANSLETWLLSPPATMRRRSQVIPVPGRRGPGSTRKRSIRSTAFCFSGRVCR